MSNASQTARIVPATAAAADVLVRYSILDAVDTRTGRGYVALAIPGADAMTMEELQDIAQEVIEREEDLDHETEEWVRIDDVSAI